MAYALHVYVADATTDEVHVEHVFYGRTRSECLSHKAGHLEACEYFRAADRDGRTDEEFVEIDESDIPTMDPDEDDEDLDDAGEAT